MAKLSYAGYKYLRSKGYTDDIIQQQTGSEIPNVFSRQVQMEKEAEPVDVKKYMPSLYGTDITPEMEQRNPYLMATAKTARETIANPLTDFVNQRLLNLPRGIGEGVAGGSYPESESGAGKFLQKGAGILGAFQSLGKGIPGQVARQSRRLPLLAAKATSGKPRAIAQGISKFFSAPSRFQKLPSALTKGAISGGIAAPLYTETDKPFDVKGRLARIPLGMGLGATVALAAHGSGKVSKAIREARKRRITGKQKADIGTKLKPTQILLEDKIKLRKARIKKLGKQKLRPVEEKIDELTEKEAVSKGVFEQRSKEAIAKHETVLADADKRLHDISQETGETLKKSITKFRGDFNKSYGKRVDVISDKIANSGDDIMRSQIDDIMQTTIGDLTDDGMTIPSKLKDLAKRYTMKAVNEAGEEIDVPDAPVKFRKLLNEIRSLTEGKESIFKGTAQAKSAQRSELALKRNLGDYISSKDKDFAKLQKESRPIYEKLKHLSKATKPYSPETKPATTFTRKYAESVASGKTDKFTKESIDMLEDGIKTLDEDIKGAGKFTQKAIKEAQAISQAKKPLTTYNEQGKKQVDALKKVVKSIQQDLEEKLEKAEGTGFMGKARINAIKEKVKKARGAYKWFGRIGTALTINQLLSAIRELTRKSD